MIECCLRINNGNWDEEEKTQIFALNKYFIYLFLRFMVTGKCIGCYEVYNDW